MKRTLALALLAVAPIPVFAQVIVNPGVDVVKRNGTASGFWTRGGSGGINAVALSWNQPAGTQFHNANITIMMHSTVNGVTAQGLAYLYRAPGLNASLSSATLVAGPGISPLFDAPPISTAFTVPSPFVAFTGGTPLASPTDSTFFVVIVPAAGAAGDALAIDFADPLDVGTGTTTYTGVTVNSDRVTTGAVGTPPNTTTTFVAASPNTVLYQVNAEVGAPATPAPTGVPTLGTWALLATVALLGGAALLRLRTARAA